MAEFFEKRSCLLVWHNLDVIPRDLINDNSDIGKYTLLTVPEADLFDINPFLNNLKNPKTVTGIAYHRHPSFPRFFAALAENGIKSSPVFTPAVYFLIGERYPEFLEEYLPRPNAELYGLETWPETLLCYLRHLSLLSPSFSGRGLFATARDVTGRDPSAIRWKERLVAHYREQSVMTDSFWEVVTGKWNSKCLEHFSLVIPVFSRTCVYASTNSDK
jgi:predicted transcriptional regulator